jgi:hypothetical protein
LPATPTTPTTRAFIIGDLDKGLTIVVTDPVMVVHYTLDELKKGKDNLLKGPNTTNLMAALVRELIPILRGVELDELDRAASRIADGTSTLNAAQQRAVFTELDYAATIARTIKAKGTVNTVDFCLGFDIDPGDIAVRVRSVSPSRDIISYLGAYSGSRKRISSKPQVFPIDGVNVRGLKVPDPWEAPPTKPPAQRKVQTQKKRPAASSKTQSSKRKRPT